MENPVADACSALHGLAKRSRHFLSRREEFFASSVDLALDLM